MSHPEPLTLRATVIGGKRWPDDYTVIWRGLTIGRIMLAPGLHVPQWRWTCNFYGKPGGGGGGSGADLADCKMRFRAMWASVKAGLTNDDIARAHEMRRT